MIPHLLLAELHRTHELLAALFESVAEADSHQVFHPDLAPLAWYFGRAVYLETRWLRGVIAGDDDLSGRVEHIFANPDRSPAESVVDLPTRDHLLNWALEIFDEDLTRLANPGTLPDHPLLKDGWILGYLVQALSRIYEEMVLVLIQRQLRHPYSDYRVQQPLVPALPRAEAVAIDQGHYRIGAREGIVFDNEQPAMMVELHSYRIQARPVSNAQYLAFLVDGGYEEPSWWTEEGRAWLGQQSDAHPDQWRRDAEGRWFGIGVNGPADLVATDPVNGICSYEAEAFSNWAADRGDGLGGAVLQHEFQWEVAARGGSFEDVGRTWEWCGNPFEPYDAYVVPETPEMATSRFDGLHRSVRGAALHTQPGLRRASLRHCATPASRHLLTGMRLVLPSATH